VLDFTYGFNAGSANNGNVAAIANNRETTRSQSFTYDELNRIKSAQTQATSGGNAWGLSFGYDVWANLLSATVTQGSALPLGVGVNAKNQVSNTGFVYDAAGNMTSDGSLSVTYDAENRIISTNAGVTYTYDGDGKRVKKSNGKLYWYGTGSDPLEESDLSGTATADYIFFNSKRTARLDLPSATVHYYFANHLGSASVVTSSAGAIQDESDYYPFGGERAVTDTDPNHYKFTGKERDTESGLDNFGARYDASSLGRFMTPDPLMASAHVSNPQTWNRYSYALNNPLRITDPEGLYPSPAYNCDKDHKACLNDQQRALLEKSTITDKNGNKLSGEKLYNSLSEKQQNAFVNVTDRLASIKLSDGSTALSKVTSLTSIETDRVKGNVDASLGNLIKNDDRFHSVSGALHPGYDESSYKSKENELNVQFSFGPGAKVADIDQDLYQDWRHGWEVISNHATGTTTNQDTVRKMMIARPEIGITPSTDQNWNRPQQ
jgi:RHS repeat-associated protein